MQQVCLISQNSKNTSSQILRNPIWKTEKDAELSAKYQIYNTLIKSAVYTTQSEGKLIWNGSQQS
jgi:predicted oxidoreductase (fatty acid repression mutant protein)